MIHAVTAEELPALTRLGESAFQEGLLPAFDAGAWVFHWEKILASGVGSIWAFYSGDVLAGALGVVAEADLYTGEAIACESFWYVLPEARGLPVAVRLLGEYDRWAKAKGCVRQYISHHLTQQAEGLQRLYSRRGFEPVTVDYGREVM